MSIDHSPVTHRKERPPRWVIAALAVVILAFVAWGTIAQYTTKKEAEVSSSNAQVLAQEITRVCEDSGTFVVNERDVCAKGEAVLNNPAEVIAGPKGDKGDKGDQGDPGQTGATGARGEKGDTGAVGSQGVAGSAGEAGATGATGSAGEAGAAGVQGEPGAMGPVGPAGPAGPQGVQGEKGDSPSSITYTDGPMAGYTCVPDPPGSTSYTCKLSEPQQTATPKPTPTATKAP